MENSNKFVPESAELTEDLCNPTFQVNPSTRLSLDYINALGALSYTRTSLELFTEDEQRVFISGLLSKDIPSYETYFRQRATLPEWSEDNKNSFNKLLRIAPQNKITQLNTLINEFNQDRQELLQKYLAGNKNEVITRCEEIYKHVHKILSEA